MQPPRLKFERLSKKKTIAMLRESGWTVNEDLTNRYNQLRNVFPIDPIYEHSDGRILWVELAEHTGQLYTTRSDFEYQLNFMAAMALLPPAKHFLLHLNFDGEKAFFTHLLPQGDQFIGQIPALIEQLPDVLPISKEALDFTLDSLKHFDRAIRKVGITNCYSPTIIPPIIAYAGECLRRATNSEWELHQSKEFPDVWEPWLRDKAGIYRAPWFAVVATLDDSPFSIQGAITSEIRFPRFRQGPNPPRSNRVDTIYITSASEATPSPDS